MKQFKSSTTKQGILGILYLWSSLVMNVPRRGMFGKWIITKIAEEKSEINRGSFEKKKKYDPFPYIKSISIKP